LAPKSDPAVPGLGYLYTDTIDGLRVINNTVIRGPYGFINNSPNHDKNIAILHNYFDIQNRVETSSKTPTQITP
jgi:penicillin V acylase-like amidase (Ntn superfamily)